MECMLAYVTVPDMETARRIGRAVVERRLAACVNILPGMESMYWWNAEVQSGSEVVLLAKTTRASFAALTECAAGLHPYEVPCVVGVPLVDGHEPFLRWICEETAPEKS